MKENDTHPPTHTPLDIHETKREILVALRDPKAEASELKVFFPDLPNSGKTHS